MVDTAAVLHAVNAVRVACGGQPLDDLRKGNHSSNSCPLANSLKDVLPGVSVSTLGVSGVPRNRAHAVAAVSDGKVTSINGKADVSSPLFSQFVREFDGQSSELRVRYERYV